MIQSIMIGWIQRSRRDWNYNNSYNYNDQIEIEIHIKFEIEIFQVRSIFMNKRLRDKNLHAGAGNQIRLIQLLTEAVRWPSFRSLLPG